MQLEIKQFANTPTYSELICKSIIKRCDQIKFKKTRSYKMMSIKQILNDTQI